MGMFVYVDHEEPCPDCGEPLIGWQSKSYYDLSMQTVQVEDLAKGGSYYDLCDICKAWVEYVRVGVDGHGRWVESRLRGRKEQR